MSGFGGDVSRPPTFPGSPTVGVGPAGMPGPPTGGGRRRRSAAGGPTGGGGSPVGSSSSHSAGTPGNAAQEDLLAIEESASSTRSAFERRRGEAAELLETEGAEDAACRRARRGGQGVGAGLAAVWASDRRRRTRSRRPRRSYVRSAGADQSRDDGRGARGRRDRGWCGLRLAACRGRAAAAAKLPSGLRAKRLGRGAEAAGEIRRRAELQAKLRAEYEAKLAEDEAATSEARQRRREAAEEAKRSAAEEEAKKREAAAEAQAGAEAAEKAAAEAKAKAKAEAEPAPLIVTEAQKEQAAEYERAIAQYAAAVRLAEAEAAARAEAVAGRRRRRRSSWRRRRRRRMRWCGTLLREGRGGRGGARDGEVEGHRDGGGGGGVQAYAVRDAPRAAAEDGRCGEEGARAPSQRRAWRTASRWSRARRRRPPPALMALPTASPPTAALPLAVAAHLRMWRARRRRRARRTRSRGLPCRSRE